MAGPSSAPVGLVSFGWTGHCQLRGKVAEFTASWRTGGGVQLEVAGGARPLAPRKGELRAAHDVLAGFYADRLADALDRMPADRAVLGLFCDLVTAAHLGTSVGDIGCGTGRLAPFLAARALSPHLSPEMVRVAGRDHPEFVFDLADLRELPVEDVSLAGVVCWYSLMYLAPSARPLGFSELARVVKPGGYLVTAFKTGDNQVRRGGRTANLGVEFDIYWLSPDEMQRLVMDAGLTPVFWSGRPAEGQEGSPQGYLVARRS